MPLTRKFKRTIQDRVQRDPAFREALLREGMECMLDGDVETGKALLRDFINATIGFEGLSKVSRKPSKSLMRMFGRHGNPQARNLFEIVGHLQKREGVRLRIRCSRKSMAA